MGYKYSGESTEFRIVQEISMLSDEEMRAGLRKLRNSISQGLWTSGIVLIQRGDISQMTCWGCGQLHKDKMVKLNKSPHQPGMYPTSAPYIARYSLKYCLLPAAEQGSGYLDGSN